MKKMIKAVIFDQDGLMYDTERVSVRAWRRAEKEFGVHIDESLLSRCRGRSIAEAKVTFLEVLGSDFDYDSLRSKKTEYYIQDINTNGLPIKKGLRELLSYLKENQIKVALATASSEEWAMKYMDMVGIREYFDKFVCGDMVTHCKPDPELFLTAAGLLQENPENCLILEDSLNGVEAGLRGNFPVVMVPDITQPDEALEKKLFAKCDSLLDVRELFVQGTLFSE